MKGHFMRCGIASALLIIALLIFVLVLNYFGSSVPQTDYGAAKTVSSVFATNTAVEQAIQGTHLAQTIQAQMTTSPTPSQSATN
jgi:hypothetical protein